MPTRPVATRRNAAAPPRRVALKSFLLAAALAAPCAAQERVDAAAPTRPGVPEQVVGALDKLFAGPHPGARAVHAKGLLCGGTFTPAPGAAALSRAPHLRGPDLPVLVRFSNFAAVPGLPDGHPAASPRGLAVKFLLPDGGDTDIVAHSYDGFPAGTPEEFLAFLRAVPDPSALAAHVAEHPAARAFVGHPKPTPASYATEAYFGVNAFRFTNAAGASRYGRYRILPLAGTSHLSADEAAARARNFLAGELADRMRRGPVAFRLAVQLAEEGDTATDGSVPWPAERPVLDLGTITLTAPVPAGDERNERIAFVPTNLVGGIAASADPMLAARTQGYRISAERRLDAR